MVTGDSGRDWAWKRKRKSGRGALDFLNGIYVRKFGKVGKSYVKATAVSSTILTTSTESTISAVKDMKKL